MKIVFNGEERETSRHMTIASLLKELNLPPNRVAVEVNMQVVPRDRQAGYVLQEGDRLEVVTLVGGG